VLDWGFGFSVENKLHGPKDLWMGVCVLFDIRSNMSF